MDQTKPAQKAQGKEQLDNTQRQQLRGELPNILTGQQLPKCKNKDSLCLWTSTTGHFLEVGVPD